MLLAILVLLLVVAIVLVVVVLRKFRTELAARDHLQVEQERLVVEFKTEKDQLIERFKGVVDADEERARVLATLSREQNEMRLSLEQERDQRLNEMRQEEHILRMAAEQDRVARTQQLEELRTRYSAESIELTNLTSRIEALQVEFKALDEEATLQSFGFYKPRYDFADSPRYQNELDRIRGAQKIMLKTKTAATCPIEWTVNGSKVEGRKQTNQMLNLMLRAFNGECDAAVTKVKFNNVNVMEMRVKKAIEKINGLAEVQQCRISQAYLNLKLQELYLVHEFQEKLQEEKEEQRRIREQMREEELAQRELEKARLEAEREEQRYEQALMRARQEVEVAVGAKQEKLRVEIDLLQQRLAEAQAKKERAIAQAQLTRSGHVYIISNIGSFGDDVYKIGMTRRLDPLERVRELSGASVPFQFDVHAVIYSDDAPTLENALHRAFHYRRLNRVNERREFFKVTLDEIVLATQGHGEIEITRSAEAAEYRKTLAILEEERRLGATASPNASILALQAAHAVPPTSIGRS